MKAYRYRGLFAALATGIILGVMGFAAFALHKRGESVTGLMGCVPALIIVLSRFIRQRRMTLEEWKKDAALNDERNQLIMGRAALSACTAGMAALLGALLYLALREPENETALIVLVIVLLAQTFAFLIAQAIYNNKL